MLPECFPWLRGSYGRNSLLSHPHFIIFAPLVTSGFSVTCFLFLYYVLGAISQTSFWFSLEGSLHYCCWWALRRECGRADSLLLCHTLKSELRYWMRLQLLEATGCFLTTLLFSGDFCVYSLPFPYSFLSDLGGSYCIKVLGCLDNIRSYTKSLYSFKYRKSI